MDVWAARLASAGVGDNLLPISGPGILVDRRDDAFYFGVSADKGLLCSEKIRAIMQTVAQGGLDQDARLVWLFSSVDVPVAQLDQLLARWVETGEPPLLSIIGLSLGDRRHCTRGMAAFVGYEIAVAFSDPLRSRNAARNLVRLARHAFINGGLDRSARYEAIDGTPLDLRWPDTTDAAFVVTIWF
jgi:hypothetical protein